MVTRLDNVIGGALLLALLVFAFWCFERQDADYTARCRRHGYTYAAANPEGGVYCVDHQGFSTETYPVPPR